MKKALGIVFSNMHEHTVSELTANRCMGSIPVGGRYRLIDFVLSNMTHSGIENVGVVTKSNYQSLMDHLGNGSEWDLSRKNGGLVILPPFGRADMGMYHGRIQALAGIASYIRSSNAPYIIAADCDIIANMDFAQFLEAHEESGADISAVYKRMPMLEGGGKEQSILRVDTDGFVSDMLVNPQIEGEQNVFLNLIAAGREYLIDTVEECYSRGKHSFEKDILQALISRQKVFAYEFTGPALRFNSLRSYYLANIAMLEPEIRDGIFPHNRPIYTKVRDEAPVVYGLQNRVVNSLLADGCRIEGEVENSVLFRGVTVAKGAKIKNCILMQGTQVGEDSSLDYVITDKDVTIRESRMIMGFETYPVFIAKGSTV